MSASCPFCTRENPANALVCGDCARDIVIPAPLIAERDDLLRKRDLARQELSGIRAEIERLLRGNRRRSA
jgi:hypothetical protein